MVEISNWINQRHPSYTAGIELLEKHKPKSFAISLCKARVSEYNMNLLKKELQTILDKQPKIEVDAEIVLADSTIAEKLSRIRKDEFKRLNHLFMVSLRSSDHAEREAAAEQILKGFEKVIHPIQKDLKYYKNFKKLPENHYLTIKVTEEISDVDIKQQILNLRSQISKNKNKPSKKADVDKWTEQKNQLVAILKKEQHEA